MDIVNSIRKVLSKQGNQEETVPEGLCPNCWGREEYAGEFYTALEKENVNINNLSHKIGWVKDYADKHFKAIELHYKGDMAVCNKCNVKYRKV